MFCTAQMYCHLESCYLIFRFQSDNNWIVKTCEDAEFVTLFGDKIKIRDKLLSFWKIPDLTRSRRGRGKISMGDSLQIISFLLRETKWERKRKEPSSAVV